MASEGIDIKIGVDPSGAVDGVTDVGSALEKIDDNLGDIAKSGDTDLGKIEKSLKDLNQEALKTGDQFDKSIGKGTKNAAKDAEGGLSDFKDEAAQTATETAASFDGSAESIVGMFQETAAKALEGFGPAGAAAGIAIAAGIGIAQQAFDKSTADAERLKGKISELAAALIESGGNLNLDYVVNTLKDLATGAGDGEKSLLDLKKIAEKSGQSFTDLANAVGGNVDNYDELIAASQANEAQLFKEMNAIAAADAERRTAATDAYNASKEYTAQLQDSRTVAESAAAAQLAYAEAGVGELQAKLDVQGQINQAYDDAAGNIEPYINEESKLFDTAAYITAMQEREQALADYQAALATSGLDSNAKAFLATQGEEAAAAMLQGYTNGDAATRAELSRIWTEAGKKASGDASKEIDAGLKDDKTVKVTADTGLASEAIKTWNPGTKTIDILVTWKDKRTGQVIP